MGIPLSPIHSSTKARRFSINAASNFVRIAIAAATWMVLTPFLIKTVGIEAYGVIALAFTIYKMISLLDGALRIPFVRFLTLALSSGQSINAKSYFNTGLFSSLFFLGVAICISPFIFFHISFFLEVPTGYELQSGFVLAAGLLSGVLPLIQNVFESTPFARNRLDLVNLSLASKNIILLVGIIIGFYFFGPVLWHVGLWFIVSGLASLVVAIWIWSSFGNSGLRISLRYFNFSNLREICSMGSWVALNQAGALLLVQINVFIINAYLGAVVQGRFSAVQQWEMLVRMGSAALSSALVPALLGKYATKGKKDLVQISVRAVKWLSIALSLPVGVLVGLGGPLMGIWLGPEYRSLAPLVLVLIGPLCVTVAFPPLLSVQMALNKVRWPAVVTLSAGLLSILLAFWWIHWIPELGLGVALAGVLGLSCKHLFFTPIYTSKILEVPIKTFIYPIFPGFFGTLIVGLGCYGISLVHYPVNLLQIGIIAGAVVVPYCFIAFCCFFTSSEKTMLYQMFFSKR